MMIQLKSRNGGDPFYINVELIEVIFEREGNTSEILLTSGRRYASIESPDTISKRIETLRKLSELSNKTAT